MDTTLSIEERLRLHKLWLDGDPDGVRFVEHGDALKDADIRGAKLRRARLDRARLDGADCRGVDLHGARLDVADIRGADIRGADIDFSSWPLWCGSKGVIVDERIFRQLVDHLLAVVCDTDEAREAQRWLKDHVGRSHRAEDLGLMDG